MENKKEIEDNYYLELEDRKQKGINYKGQVAGRHPDVLSTNEMHVKVEGFIEGYNRAMEELASQSAPKEAIEFAKWLSVNDWKSGNGIIYARNFGFIDRTPENKTAQELYELFKNTQSRDDKNKKFTPFYLKSECCNYDIKLYRGEDVGYIKCDKCDKQCDIIKPDDISQKFQYEIMIKIKALDYYTENKEESVCNYKKSQLLDEVLDTWRKIYSQSGKEGTV